MKKSCWEIRSSCSDDNVCNGFSYNTHSARCKKCHLIEILNGEWGDRFDVDISINIDDTEY